MKDLQFLAIKIRDSSVLMTLCLRINNQAKYFYFTKYSEKERKRFISYFLYLRLIFEYNDINK